MLAQTALFHLHELRDTTVRVCRHITQDEDPVLHVIRAADGSWMFLCGRDHRQDHHEGQALPLKEMVKIDPSLNAISALAPHDYAERPAADEPWVQGDQLALEIPACIEQHGWFVALVSDENISAPTCFAYTIGMPVTQSHCELLMIGQPSETVAKALNTLGDRISNGARLEPNTNLVPISGLSLHAKPVHPTWYRDYLGYGLWYHGSEDFDILQIYWADAEGRFPWDPGCDPEVVRQQPDLSRPKQ